MPAGVCFASLACFLVWPGGVDGRLFPEPPLWPGAVADRPGGAVVVVDDAVVVDVVAPSPEVTPAPVVDVVGAGPVGIAAVPPDGVVLVVVGAPSGRPVLVPCAGAGLEP